MRRLLSIPLAVFAVVLVRVGWEPLHDGAPERVVYELQRLARGEVPASPHLAIEGAVLLSDGGGAGHVVGGEAFLPVMTQRVAKRVVRENGLDLDRASGLVPVERIVVARVKLDDLRGVVEASGAARGDSIVGPIALEGVVEDYADWPDEARAKLASVGLEPDRALAIAHGVDPRGRVFGVLAMVMAVFLGWFARRLWGRRAPESAVSPAGEGPPVGRPTRSLPRPTGKFVAGAAALGVTAIAVAGKLADGAARVADDVGAARAMDDVARRGLGADDVADGIIRALDLGKKAQEWHRYVSAVHGADITLQAILVERDSTSTYRGADGRFELTEYRAVREMRDVRDGDAGPVQRIVDTDVPDGSRAEHDRARLHPPTEGRPAAVEFDALVRSSSGTMTFRCRAEVEVVEGSWAGFARGEPIELRYTEAGLEALGEATSSVLERGLSRAMAREMTGVARREIEVESTSAQCRIRADAASLRVEALGPSLSEVRILGWR